MKATLTIGAIAALLAGTCAEAVTINLGGVANPTLGGTTSRFVYNGTSQQISPDGVINCNDYPGQPQLCGDSQLTQISNDQAGNGSIGGYNDSLKAFRLAPNGVITTDPQNSPTGNSYNVVNDVQTQTSGGAASPVYDGYVNLAAGGAATVLPGGMNTPLTYFGLLWGSPDSYNFLQFIDDNGDVVNVDFGNFADPNHPGYLTGASIFKAEGFTSDPGNAGTAFINFVFGPGESVSGIRIGNFGNCCFEFANVTSATDPVTDPNPPAAPTTKPALLVPEPAAGAALLTGLGFMGLARRKRS